MLQTMAINDSRLFRSTLILSIAHAVGIVGMLTPWSKEFLLLTPANLVLSTFLVFRHQAYPAAKGFIFMIACFVAGFFIEVAGVHTGQIFGIYSYGRSLGPKLFDVPLTMGLNWLLLIVCMGIFLSKITVHKFIKSALGAALLVLLDVFIEPVAMRSDFWDWPNHQPPLQNFVAWFIVCFVLLVIFNYLDFRKENPMAKRFLLIQFGFFILASIL